MKGWSRRGWRGEGIGRQVYERYLEIDGKIVLEENSSPQAKPVDVDIEFRGEGYYTPAYTDGPPEYCYPEEGEVRVTDVEVVEVSYQGDSISDEEYDDSSFEFTSKEAEEAEETIAKSIKDGDLL